SGACERFRHRRHRLSPFSSLFRFASPSPSPLLPSCVSSLSLENIPAKALLAGRLDSGSVLLVLEAQHGEVAARGGGDYALGSDLAFFASWNLFWTSPPELSRQASKWVELVFFSWAVSVTTGLSISTAIYYPLSVLAEGVRHWRLWVRLKVRYGFSVVGAREEYRSWSCQPCLSFLVVSRTERVGFRGLILGCLFSTFQGGACSLCLFGIGLWRVAILGGCPVRIMLLKLMRVMDL
ncbi:unnamed protein product, partial [Brassica rapa]